MPSHEAALIGSGPNRLNLGAVAHEKKLVDFVVGVMITVHCSSSSDIVRRVLRASDRRDGHSKEGGYTTFIGDSLLT